MANLRNHVVTEVWQSKLKPNTRYYITKNDRLLRTTGPQGGGAKLLFHYDAPISGGSPGTSGFNFSGIGKMSTASAYRQRLETIAYKTIS